MILTKIFTLSNLKIFGGLYLGWGIGANDSANIFGTAVATNSIKFKTAVTLIAIFVVLGSSLKGWHLYHNYDFSKNSQKTTELKTESEKKAEIKKQYTNALISTFAAALAVTIVTILSIPASTSQAAVGAYMGITMALSGSFTQGVDWQKFLYMFVCWVATPIGSAIVSVILYKVAQKIINKIYGNDFSGLNRLYTFLLLIAGCYGAFELGANNVVVTTGPYYKAGVFGTPLTDAEWVATSFWKNPAFFASTLGGIAIAIGAITYSRKVMHTVGSKITALDPFSAMISVFAHSIALMVFTYLKVPVSSSQAIVGAVIGIGLLSGSKTMSYRTLGFIFLGWLLTPVSGAIIAFLLSRYLSGYFI